MTARPIRYQRQVSDRKGKIFYTSITSLSHISKKLGNEVKKPYSASLLALSCGRRGPLATPLAFGEGQVKERVQNVLRCRKPALWVTLTAGTAVAALVIGLLVRRPFMGLNHFMEEKLEETELL